MPACLPKFTLLFKLRRGEISMIVKVKGEAKHWCPHVTGRDFIRVKGSCLKISKISYCLLST